jgi:surfeit locus 1 family protein
LITPGAHNDVLPPALPQRGRRSPVLRAACIIIAFIMLAGFIALGTWQLERRVWKLNLIGQVEQRVHAAPAPLLGRATDSGQWPVATTADEYRHVQISGTFLNAQETLVQASTDFGSGFWVMTPLRLADGGIVLINRGFVSPERRYPATRGSTPPAGITTITGLLRMSQPGGGFLRRNDPAANRWFSRDVQAIAAARGLQQVAPWFVDADVTPDIPHAINPAAPGSAAQVWPIGGLTVVSFPNNHLVYAITWYLLALMAAVAAWRVVREPPILREDKMSAYAPAKAPDKTRGERDDGNTG